MTVAGNIYPVGAIYISVSDVTPSDILGFGTWELIKDTFLLGAGGTYQAGSTGGEATHILTIDEMPSHGHKQVTASSIEGAEWDCPPARQLSSWWDAYTTDTYTDVSGGNKPHNNMPPYLAVYIWERVA